MIQVHNFKKNYRDWTSGCLNVQQRGGKEFKDDSQLSDLVGW